jgi:hypothetical protein
MDMLDSSKFMGKLRETEMWQVFLGEIWIGMVDLKWID